MSTSTTNPREELLRLSPHRLAALVNGLESELEHTYAQLAQAEARLAKALEHADQAERAIARFKKTWGKRSKESEH